MLFQGLFKARANHGLKQVEGTFYSGTCFDAGHDN